MASRSLGSLTADLILKMGGFKQGMDAAARETDRFEQRMKKNFSRITSGFKSLAGAFGVGIGFEALRRTAAAAIEYGDEIQKASAKTGIGVEAFSELAYAAKQSDIDLNSLGTALKKMQVGLSQAGSGAKGANETLAALGLTIAELQRLSPDQQFETLADRIAGLKDPADRTRAAVELFGKAGADLLPLFEQGAAGIRAAREEAQRMGATLTKEQAAALAEADDAIKRLNQSWSGFARTLTATVAPALTAIFDTITGQNNARLRDQIDILSRFEGRGALFIGSESMGTGFRSAEQILERRIELQKQLQQLENPRTNTLPPGGRNRAPFVPGFAAAADEPKAAKISKVASETDKARERVTEFIQRLQDQTATFGLTEAAALKYSITTGELSRDLVQLGTSAAPLREQLLGLADAVSRQEATSEITKQITALEQQATTLGLTEQQAFAYSVTQGELATVLAQTGTDAESLTVRLLDVNNRLAETRLEIERQSERESIFEATRTDAEQYAASLERLRELFVESEDQETYGRAVADAAGEYVDASSAAEEYRRVIEELNQQLSAGVLTQEAYDGAIARAKETFEEAGREAGKVFADEAKRNTQDVLADFLTDPFAKGLDGLVEDFGRTFQRIAANAVAAKIAESLFSGIDGWLSKLGGLFGGGGLLGGIFSGGQQTIEGIGGPIPIPSAASGAAEGAATAAAGTATATAITTAGTATATALTTAGTATATALTTSSTAGATAITTSLAAAFASGSSALAAAGVTLAAAITSAGAAAAAAISAAGASSGLASSAGGLGDIFVTAARMANGGLVSKDWASPAFRFAEGGTVNATRGGRIFGPGTGTSDSIPAITTTGRPLLLSSGEHITRAAVVREPGAATFLASFNRYGMKFVEQIQGFATGGIVQDFHAFSGLPGFATGGLVAATPRRYMTTAGAAAIKSTSNTDRSMQIVNNFTVQAPNGSVSRATEQQIAAAAARGVARASARNN